MSTKKELLEISEIILWLEKAMRKDYSRYARDIKDERALKTLKEIENDESRHINMALRMVSILKG